MQTNEITKLLGIKKSHLRFLRDKKLFQPKTVENGYQYYTDDDAKNIKRLLIMRKAGVSVKLIQDLQSGKVTTAEALKQTERDLEAALKELQGSLSFCRSLQENNVAYESMAVDYYWDEIQRKEQEGQHFVDIVDNYMLANISLERDVECPHCSIRNKIDFAGFLVDELHYDRPMGDEIQYCFDTDDYECDSCGVDFRVVGSINEYPFGSYDSEHIVVKKI